AAAGHADARMPQSVLVADRATSTAHRLTQADGGRDPVNGGDDPASEGRGKRTNDSRGSTGGARPAVGGGPKAGGRERELGHGRIAARTGVLHHPPAPVGAQVASRGRKNGGRVGRDAAGTGGDARRAGQVPQPAR